MSNLLITEPPLQVLPTLAVSVGLNESIIFQQIHYWILMKQNPRDGYYWVYNSYTDWATQFPWCSTTTIKRAILKLEREGYLISANYNAMIMDKTKWYRIDYSKVGGFPLTQGVVQNDPTNGPKWPNERVNMTQAIPETTTETTTKTTTETKKNLKKKSENPTTLPEHTQLIEHVASIQKTTFKANFPQQVRAASGIIKSGVTLKEAIACADLMRQDDFWQTKLFDVNNLRNQLFKYLPKVQAVMERREIELNRVEYWYDYKIRNTMDDLRPGLKFTFTPEQAHELETMWDDEFKPTYQITIVQPEDPSGRKSR